MVKYEHKEYKELSKGSKDKITGALKRLDRAGITIREAKTMSDSDLKKAIGFKGKKASFEGFKRNVNQVAFSHEHRTESIKEVVKDYKRIGWKGVKLKQLEKDLVKTAGSSFISISKELQDIGYSEELSYKRAQFLLKIPKEEYETLSQQERDILTDFGT